MRRDLVQDHSGSCGPRCFLAQSRLRRWCSALAFPRVGFAEGVVRGSGPRTAHSPNSPYNASPNSMSRSTIGLIAITSHKYIAQKRPVSGVETGHTYFHSASPDPPLPWIMSKVGLSPDPANVSGVRVKTSAQERWVTTSRRRQI